MEPQRVYRDGHLSLERQASGQASRRQIICFSEYLTTNVQEV